MGILVIGVLLWFGGRMVLVSESISGTTFIVFMGLAYNILTPAKNLSKSFYSIKKVMLLLNEYSKLLSMINIPMMGPEI
ncbi:MAG: hypothetical protein CM15mP102_12990 [Flavobacteriales bacterium]|nr:MAG: hypothetical protein CM15mP102_12990 [Flavobacteriales bacterium]